MNLFAKQDKTGNYFPLPNAIFSLGLSSGELAVYAYLMYCEDRKSHQCWPSYKTIGKAVDMSRNTVQKYVRELEYKALIITEPTKYESKNGQIRNGNLIYTILPIQPAVDAYNERQAARAWRGQNR
ncbi:helix-turn-helix domain-containing protein [bacterium D16-76]|nr:helix-turn-helix domain-containing protein [bacterium D16-76]